MSVIVFLLVAMHLQQCYLIEPVVFSCQEGLPDACASFLIRGASGVRDQLTWSHDNRLKIIIEFDFDASSPSVLGSRLNRIRSDLTRSRSGGIGATRSVHPELRTPKRSMKCAS